MADLKLGLPPIINNKTSILILGSLPSDESISKHQYYANPGNDFWKLIGSALGFEIKSLNYKDKINALLDNHIGLWDVFKSAERDGSMDERIINPTVNDFDKLSRLAPKLKLICFNGKKAAEGWIYFEKYNYELNVLTSSSGAARRYSQRRIAEWSQFKKYGGIDHE